MLTRIITLAAALGLVLAVAAGEARAKEPLKIGYSDWPGYTSWEIGKVKGIFKKNGVDVELVWFPVYTDSLTAVNTGQLDGNLQTWSDLMAPLAEGIDREGQGSAAHRPRGYQPCVAAWGASRGVATSSRPPVRRDVVSAPRTARSSRSGPTTWCAA